MPITKINDEHRDTDDEGTNRCCFITLVEWDLTISRQSGSGNMAANGTDEVEGRLDIFVYYTRLMNSRTNPDDANYEDQR